MKRADVFHARSQVFERLLAERAGIGQREIAELGEVHARAGRYRRSVQARTAHAARHETPHQETGIVEAIAAGTAAPAAEPSPEQHGQPVEPAAPGRRSDAIPAWETLYDRLERDWNDLVAVADQADLPLPLMDGYDALIPRVRTLAAHADLPDRSRDELDGLLAYHEDQTVARETAEGYLAAAERHVEAYKALERQAGERGLPVARLGAWPAWREAAETLAATGKAVLANEERYGAYLDAMTIGKARAELTVEQLRNRLRENRARAPKTKERQPRPEPAPKQEQGFAHRLDEPRKSATRSPRADAPEPQGIAYILDDPEKLRELREKAEKRKRKRGRYMRRSRGLSM